MVTIGLINKITNFFSKKPSSTLVVANRTKTGGFYSWDGKLYHSDIVKACIRPKVSAVGKLLAKHVRTGTDKEGSIVRKINPEPYIRYLLEDPNPHMSGQIFQEYLTTQLCLNNNAFALIVRNNDGYPVQLYPMPCKSVQPYYDKQNNFYLSFLMNNGRYATFLYSDILHLRQDVGNDPESIFGQSPFETLAPLMEVVNATDKSIIQAIKNSAFIRWLLKINTAQRPEDIKEYANEFAESFLNVERSVGVAAVDTKADAQQVKSETYVPNAVVSEKNIQRIYSALGTNSNIVQSSYTEDQWSAYYESEIEPIAIQLSGEYTRKIFSRRARSQGNKIYFESSNLQFATLKTKLNLKDLVDRGALTPNEWRATLSLAPVPGGDEPVIRLDMGTLKELSENK